MTTEFDALFTVPIPPRGKGRPRATVNYSERGSVRRSPTPGVAVGPDKDSKPFARVYTPKSTRTFEHAVAMVSLPHRPRMPIAVATRVDILAIVERPKDRRRKIDPDGLMWAPLSRFDADNIRKAILDALQSWWTDDGVVVAGDTLHCYAEKDGEARTIIRVATIPDDLRPEKVASKLGLLGPTGALAELANARQSGGL
jgi:Holliday junction resolvase RusA-like endonuclease